MTEREVIRPRSAVYEIFVLLDSIQEQLQQIRARALELTVEQEEGADDVT